MKITSVEALANVIINMVKQGNEKYVLDTLVENIGVSDKELRILDNTLQEYFADVNVVNKNVKGNKRLTLLLGWSFECGRMGISEPEDIRQQFVLDMNEIAGVNRD